MSFEESEAKAQMVSENSLYTFSFKELFHTKSGVLLYLALHHFFGPDSPHANEHCYVFDPATGEVSLRRTVIQKVGEEGVSTFAQCVRQYLQTEFHFRETERPKHAQEVENTRTFLASIFRKIVPDIITSFCNNQPQKPDIEEQVRTFEQSQVKKLCDYLYNQVHFSESNNHPEGFAPTLRRIIADLDVEHRDHFDNAYDNEWKMNTGTSIKIPRDEGPVTFTCDVWAHSGTERSIKKTSITQRVGTVKIVANPERKQIVFDGPKAITDMMHVRIGSDDLEILLFDHDLCFFCTDLTAYNSVLCSFGDPARSNKGSR